MLCMSYLILRTVRRLHVATAHALHVLLDRDCGAELVSSPRPVRRLQSHHLHRDVLLERGDAGVGDSLVAGSRASVDQQVTRNNLEDKLRIILGHFCEICVTIARVGQNVDLRTRTKIQVLYLKNHKKYL